MSEYPEHEKLKDVQEQSQACGEFLDWLQRQGIRLMVYREDIPDEQLCPEFKCNRGRVYVPNSRETIPCPTCHGTGYASVLTKGWLPEQRSTETLLAYFFGIDQDKLEAEKRAMLDEIRAPGVAR